MFRCAIPRYVNLGAAILLGMAVAAGSALAQMQQTAPPASGAPPAPPAEKRPAEQTTMGTLEGAAKNVDPGAGTLQVSDGGPPEIMRDATRNSCLLASVSVGIARSL